MIARVAAGVVLAGALAGCGHTVTGTVAMTTEPGATTRTTSKPSTSPRTSSPRTSTPATPGDAQSVTCSQYNDLDDADKTAVIDEILATEGSMLGPENTDIAKTLADAVCQFLPNGKVSEILLGSPPP